MKASMEGQQIMKLGSGIDGLDEVLNGGLPKGRSTLICGGSGSGKTLMAIQFLVAGARRKKEPVLLVAFEEVREDLIANCAGLGWDLAALEVDGLFEFEIVEPVLASRVEAGSYDLTPLLMRIKGAARSVGAKRIAIDSVDTLFGAFSDTTVIRHELLRLIRELSEMGLTIVLTGEKGDGHLTRDGFLEYMVDCVISLDHRVSRDVATRRLRVVKYRGSRHGDGEYPFVILDDGISVLPITSVTLDYEVSKERQSLGVPALDEMLGGKGLFKGASLLISGTAGTGKSSLACRIVEAVCRDKRKALYWSFEESKHQIVRNMASVGLDLAALEESGRLFFEALRPSRYGLEHHLINIQNHVAAHDISLLVLDPISAFPGASSSEETRLMLTRLLSFLRRSQVTCVMITLHQPDKPLEWTEMDVSSLVDTWITLSSVEKERKRSSVLRIIKSRGMKHSRDVADFELTDDGIKVTIEPVST